MGLFAELSGDPYDQAGTRDGKKDAGDPAVAGPDQVPQESADDTADETQHHIPENPLGRAFHDFVRGTSAQAADGQ